MPLYEHVLLARPDISVKQVNAIVDSCRAVILDCGGEVGKTEYWGLRPTAYRIKKNRKAHYALLNLNCSQAAVAEMNRQLSVNEDILRSLTLRVKEWEEGPSVMMKRDARYPREHGDRFARSGRRFDSGSSRPEREGKGATSGEVEVRP